MKGEQHERLLLCCPGGGGLKVKYMYSAFKDVQKVGSRSERTEKVSEERDKFPSVLDNN